MFHFSVLLLLYIVWIGTVLLVGIEASSVSSSSTTTTTPKSQRATTTASPPAKTTLDHAQAQITWIRSYGGFVSDKLEIRRVHPDDEESPYGLFTTQDLRHGETVMVIPRKCLLTAGSESHDVCETTRNLMREYKLKERSFYAPYVDYLLDPHHHYQAHVPSAWSKEGQDLLERILGRELPPNNNNNKKSMTSINFQTECGGAGLAFGQKAYLTVVQRSWDEKLVPLLDMANHRNGQWFNLDSTPIHADALRGEEEEPISVFVRRPVQAGEQLYLSYNECADCEGFAHTYVLQDILRDYGFIEDYPRRWRFRTNDYSDDDPGTDLVFEIDKKKDKEDLSTTTTTNTTTHDNDDEFTFTWLSAEPDDFDLAFLRGHLVRLEALHENVTGSAAKLEHKYERSVVLEFYHALMEALDLALWSTKDVIDHTQHECELQNEQTNAGNKNCTSSSSHVYDALDELEDQVAFNGNTVDFSYRSYKSYEMIDFMETPHQVVEFTHSEERQDTCLYLDDILHACTSTRPQYHEVFVHYPAQFVDTVRRVAYVGGGDIMLLHEILKYPSLELVVGMELDHEVVRSSFQNLGTQPHWDNEKVEWWYGDGAKSILMLPQDYYGSFDLVLVDLLSEVADGIGVMDTAVSLLNPDGVIARNEDWFFGTNKPFARYTVDLFYVDIPMFANQGITLGSNSVDFTKRTRKDHKIDTLYLDPPNAINRFQRWYNYKQSDVPVQEFCSKWPEKNLSSNSGALMIVEAEEASIPSMSPNDLQLKISTALKHAGLNEVATEVSPPQVVDTTGQSSIVSILKEGYVVTRFDQKHPSYYGFDVMLWDSFERFNDARRELTTAVGSVSSSAYRIVLNNMHKGDGANTRGFGPNGDVNPMCERSAGEKLAEKGLPIDPSLLDAVLEESLSLAQETSRSVLVVCGEAEQPCSSYEVLKKQSNTKVFPIYTCPGISHLSQTTTNATSMFECESAVSLQLNEHTKENNVPTNVIVVDSKVPRAMGQILYTTLCQKKLRKRFLTKHLVLLATSLGQLDAASWRNAFFDRFRTRFSRFDPAHRAEVSFYGPQGGLMELDVFSSGDFDFYSHLAESISAAERRTGLESTLQYVKNGINNYVPDYVPSLTTTNKDYDHGSALKQWQSQQYVGRQIILQFFNRPTVDNSDEHNLSTAKIREAFGATLEALLLEEGRGVEEVEKSFHQTGQVPCIIFASWLDSSAILLWEGRGTAITLNLYTRGSLDLNKFYHLFESHFHSTLYLSSYEDLPRGHGRIVNFPDHANIEPPLWSRFVRDA